jgi:hypothetical protein
VRMADRIVKLTTASRDSSGLPDAWGGFPPVADFFHHLAQDRLGSRRRHWMPFSQSISLPRGSCSIIMGLDRISARIMPRR